MPKILDIELRFQNEFVLKLNRYLNLPLYDQESTSFE